MMDTAFIGNRKSAIGVFDSGVGGLTVFRAIELRLPNESLIYLGDTARIPYGVRSAATIERYALECANFVQSKGVKAIVIACNTASALAANYLRSKCSVPVIGVIRPGSRRAVEATRNERMAIRSPTWILAKRWPRDWRRRWKRKA